MLDAVLWVVIVGAFVMFALAFGIGANDVSNSLGTSIGSKVLTYRQAILVAGIFEFLGSVLIGSQVTDTIRSKIVSLPIYAGEPELLMIVMLSALFGGAIWLIIASAFRMPVSTTHTTIGAIIGASLAAKGAVGVNWEKFGFIVLSWVVSPLASGIISAILFLVVRHLILRSDHPLKRGFILLPVIYGITFFINTFFIIYKGVPGLDLELWLGMVISISVGVGAALVIIWPGIYLLKKYIEWKQANVMIHYVNEHPNVEMVIKQRENKTAKTKLKEIETQKTIHIDHESSVDIIYKVRREHISKDGCCKGCWGRFQLFWLSQDYFLGGNAENDLDERIRKLESKESAAESTENCDLQDQSKSGPKCRAKCRSCLKHGYTKFHGILDRLTGQDNTRTNEVRENAERFHAKTETLFSVLQVLTACFDSFAHGANDVANAVAPFAAIYAIYSTGIVGSKSTVPIWILAIGGFGIVVGLIVWGYRVIQTIGRNLVKITASRGFCIELGSALSVVTASYLGFPVSTTHAQVGSVVAIGLTEGIKQVNGWLLIGILASWVLTLPFSGAFAALFLVIIRAGTGY
jgi:sodium-dependent phosphate transporter